MMNHSEVALGTPLSPGATRILLLGSGELGKEVVIELQRLGVETIAVDRYADAPAMQVAHRSHVVSMLDVDQLRGVVELERPHFVVPEIEAIHTETLLELEHEGCTVIPTARAVRLTMDREGIRKLAAKTLQLPTSPYCFAASAEEYRAAVASIGIPCVVKPLMSSSGRGQSVIRKESAIDVAWERAQSDSRGGGNRVIVEGFVDFDYEVTLLAVRHLDANGCPVTSFCSPIGHHQESGDYRESWQPHPISGRALAEAQRQARILVDDLCTVKRGARPSGRGVFGVEFFVRGDEVIFSEVSPRPHDTGLVTLISQDLSEFSLHARAILGLPIPTIRQFGPAASCALIFNGPVKAPSFEGLSAALSEQDTMIRLFGKPEVIDHRRMGVTLARDTSVAAARAKARRAAAAVHLVDSAVLPPRLPSRSR